MVFLPLRCDLLVGAQLRGTCCRGSTHYIYIAKGKGQEQEAGTNAGHLVRAYLESSKPWERVVRKHC